LSKKAKRRGLRIYEKVDRSVVLAAREISKGLPYRAVKTIFYRFLFWRLEIKKTPKHPNARP